MLQPVIKTFPEKKLIGQHVRMSLSDNKTFKLWSGFMPRRKEINNAVSTDLFSLQVYDASLVFSEFNLQTTFEKWAAIEVPDFNAIPDRMDTLTVEEGLYAVFLYKGEASKFAVMFDYIFNEWLPSSEYELDRRPHFEILGPKYKNEHPDSEEDICIPIKKK